VEWELTEVPALLEPVGQEPPAQQAEASLDPASAVSAKPARV